MATVLPPLCPAQSPEHCPIARPQNSSEHVSGALGSPSTWCVCLSARMCVCVYVLWSEHTLYPVCAESP